MNGLYNPFLISLNAAFKTGLNMGCLSSASFPCACFKGSVEVSRAA